MYRGAACHGTGLPSHPRARRVTHARAVQGGKNRITVCISSQVGCAMGCKFCYTGRMGLLQNLSAAQIVEQLVQARRHLAQEGVSESATNIVFMGMGASLAVCFARAYAVCKSMHADAQQSHMQASRWTTWTR